MFSSYAKGIVNNFPAKPKATCTLQNGEIISSNELAVIYTFQP